MILCTDNINFWRNVPARMYHWTFPPVRRSSKNLDNGSLYAFGVWFVFIVPLLRTNWDRYPVLDSTLPPLICSPVSTARDCTSRTYLVQRYFAWRHWTGSWWNFYPTFAPDLASDPESECLAFCFAPGSEIDSYWSANETRTPRWAGC